VLSHFPVRIFFLWGLFVIVSGCTSTPVGEALVVKPAVVAPATKPQDAYVLLSGGGTPLSNNYSQYLQARELAAFFGRTVPAGSSWVFFGIGNREGVAPVLADTRKEFKEAGYLLQSWLPGSLPQNRPATKESFLRALRDEILPTVSGGGTLYLFVGDHGEWLGKDEKRESGITMWQLKAGGRRSGGWSTDEKEVLGVRELREVLVSGLGRGSVVFCMTQCHSGGFHELGVAREMTPPRAWFSIVPSWAGAVAGGMRLRVAGFTATDEASLAAGCDADPDPEKWAGYERFFPESLLGVDLMSGQSKGRGASSLAAAHEVATLVDQTIDKPRSTSEHYLESWARLIETRLATTLSVTAKTQQAVVAFQRAVDTGVVRGVPVATATATAAATAAAWRERQAQFARFTVRLVEQIPAAKDLLQAGTRAQLEAAVSGRGERGGGVSGRGNRRAAMAEMRKTWSETLRPAWKVAVAGGMVSGVSGAVLEFERHLLKLEDDGRDFMFPRGNNDTPLLNEIYWNSGYAKPAKLDPVKAADVARWGAERRARVVAWGATSSEAAVRAAAEKMGPGLVSRADDVRPISRKTAAERVLFYRRVLAAWAFLIEMDAQPALAELRTLIDLERTPLPAAVGRPTD